ncbi:MAG: hypothetical protein ACTHZY_13245 [Halomonas sp.]
MNLPMEVLYETYAHFDVVHDAQTALPDTTVRVCDALSCQLARATSLCD